MPCKTFHRRLIAHTYAYQNIEQLVIVWRVCAVWWLQRIDFSKRGIDGFDFGRYNRTPLAGLENLLPNR
jgi:hypothetical protein